MLSIITSLENIRQNTSLYWDTLFPNPHGLLLKGMTLGIDDLSAVPDFKQALVSCGLIHVVVVSGYNINLVSDILGKFYRQLSVRYCVISSLLCLLYAIFTGFSGPVVRAWLMYSIIQIAKVYGRKADGMYLCVLVYLITYLLDKEVATSISYLLSMAATLGIISLGDMVYKMPIMKNLGNYSVIKHLIPDLVSSISAQLTVWPIISFMFSSVSPFAPIYNMFILWIIPIATIFGFVLFITTQLDVYLYLNISHYVSFLIMPPLDIFYKYVVTLEKLGTVQVAYKLTVTQLIAYYTCLSAFIIRYKYIGKK